MPCDLDAPKPDGIAEKSRGLSRASTKGEVKRRNIRERAEGIMAPVIVFLVVFLSTSKFMLEIYDVRRLDIKFQEFFLRDRLGATLNCASSLS
jgi:hypothetical protein